MFSEITKYSVTQKMIDASLSTLGNTKYARLHALTELTSLPSGLIETALRIVALIPFAFSALIAFIAIKCGSKNPLCSRVINEYRSNNRGLVAGLIHAVMSIPRALYYLFIPINSDQSTSSANQDEDSKLVPVDAEKIAAIAEAEIAAQDGLFEAQLQAALIDTKALTEANPPLMALCAAAESAIAALEAGRSEENLPAARAAFSALFEANRLSLVEAPVEGRSIPAIAAERKAFETMKRLSALIGA